MRPPLDNCLLVDVEGSPNLGGDTMPMAAD
ncbi:hypothetical protein PAHAL_9G318400 [Panicum hallii]|uniref:Uncharacterized protein n=1 Tax=Panicum hallii TaxID=206008 RepID=A0A2T8I357_9POAL|nr:hypothetical protein PAHAL_9G318400 [Panicum hallii]